MSTELYEAKAIADDIHDIADVPEKKNNDIYNMTLHQIGNLIVEMDKRGITMNEQRVRMGRKKDELIRELISLRQRGILMGKDDTVPAAAPVSFHMSQIEKVKVRREPRREI